MTALPPRLRGGAGAPGKALAAAALAAVLRRAEEEQAHVVWNGDFNFFNTNPHEWSLVNDTVRRGCEAGRMHAIAGNVEVEVGNGSRTGLSYDEANEFKRMPASGER